MTNQITIPRETFDAMREALDGHVKAYANPKQNDEGIRYRATVKAREALTAANAVQPQAPKFWEPSSFEVEAALVAQSKAFMGSR